MRGAQAWVGTGLGLSEAGVGSLSPMRSGLWAPAALTFKSCLLFKFWNSEGSEAGVGSLLPLGLSRRVLQAFAVPGRVGTWRQKPCGS